MYEPSIEICAFFKDFFEKKYSLKITIKNQLSEMHLLHEKAQALSFIMPNGSPHFSFTKLLKEEAGIYLKL